MKKSKEATAYTVDNSLRKEKLGQEMVFPIPEGLPKDYEYNPNTDRISKRFYAAVKLGVPDSGEEWLDLMIIKSNRRKAACAAMRGIISNSDLRTSILLDSHNAKCTEEELLVAYSYNYADEVLKRENE